MSDPGRVFRQVHRVLKTGAPLVFSVVHPASRLDMSSYWAGYTIADLYGGLQRANFEVDTLLEPEPTRTSPPTLAPQTLVMRGRKLGL